MTPLSRLRTFLAQPIPEWPRFTVGFYAASLFATLLLGAAIVAGIAVVEVE